jgi:hypothetical protein
MDLNLPAWGSLLIGFEKTPAQVPSSPPAPPIPAKLPAPVAIFAWHLETALRSPDGKSKPVVLDLNPLRDWREIQELKGCSTPGKYTAEVNLDQGLFQPGVRLFLDLGDARDAAEVKINGRPAGTLLVPPFACGVTNFLKPGKNTIEVLVTPTLYNRLIRFGNSGDKRFRQFKGRTNLMPSGLLGPVVIRPSLSRER